MNRLLQSCLIAAAITLVSVGATNAADSKQTSLLKARNAEFAKDIVRVSDSVYTAVGYGVSPVSMIVGSEGLVIVDTGIDAITGAEIRQDFRAITDLPVKAIVFTHGHPDHIRGASAFVDDPGVQVWAHEDFGHEASTLTEAGIVIQKRRGGRQAGFQLSPEQRINNGIAKAYWPAKKGAVFGADKTTVPTHFVGEERAQVSVAGIEIELVPTNGETPDHVYVWFAQDRVVFSGDNFYKSWPNLYAIRGTPYRDVRQWANAVDQLISEQPDAVVGGHTRPVIGGDNVRETLSNYRDAIVFLFDKTVEGINKGMTPNQLVDYVVLPDKYQNLDYLRPYYGNPEWAVRAIFTGYLGWFDGNASNLFPLSDSDEAQRFVKAVGGMEALLQLISDASAEGDYQWVAQLCDHALALDPDNASVMLSKAEALTSLSEKVLTATARNYYISSAIELRRAASSKAP